MKKALGKGLSALIPDSYINKQPGQSAPAVSGGSVATMPAGVSGAQARQAFRLVPVTKIHANRDQVRHDFDPSAIEELAASIREKGILQPILVKEIRPENYEIICGERRFRAAQLCGLTEVPVVVKDIADKEFLEWALIENIQRQDLNALEEAEAYRRLADERQLSQEQIAGRVGKSRAAVANSMRLLQLPVEIRRQIEESLLTAGHARALLGLLSPEHQRQLAKRIIEEGLSVRQAEALASRAQARKRGAKSARNLTPEIVDLEHKLSTHFGTQVKIFPRKNKSQGRVEIQYYSLDDLDRILEKSGLSLES